MTKDKTSDSDDDINIVFRAKGALARDCNRLLDERTGYYSSGSELVRDALRRLIEGYKERGEIG